MNHEIETELIVLGIFAFCTSPFWIWLPIYILTGWAYQDKKRKECEEEVLNTAYPFLLGKNAALMNGDLDRAFDIEERREKAVEQVREKYGKWL